MSPNSELYDLELGDYLQCFASGADAVETESASGLVDQPVLIKEVAFKPFRSKRSLGGVCAVPGSAFGQPDLSVAGSRLTSRRILIALRQEGRNRPRIVPVVHPGDPAPLVVRQVDGATVVDLDAGCSAAWRDCSATGATTTHASRTMSESGVCCRSTRAGFGVGAGGVGRLLPPPGRGFHGHASASSGGASERARGASMSLAALAFSRSRWLSRSAASPD